MSERIPVAAGLFAETKDGARLIGSRCATCGTPYFPKVEFCRHPECTASRIEEAGFGPNGTIWSCAIQDYPPPAPARFDKPYQPYAMAVVDLADGLRVLGQIKTDDIRSVTPDTKVTLVVDTLCHDEAGNEIVTWKFRPVEGAGARS
jgi:uncharacterized OB-fold protein